jgi:pimeloyl-ACP methyl ester carboxylesterase
MAITADGTAYDLFGPQHAPAVVLIHGLGMTRATWDDIVPVLARNFRVVTYDLSGHGDSRLPSTTPSLTVLSEQLKTLLETLSIPQAALVGFSLGGMINRRFAIDYRDIVTALIVLNSPHERDPAAQRLVEERAAQTSAGGAQATIDTTLERWFTSEFRKKSAETVAKIRRWVLANDSENYTQNRQVLAAGVVELIRPDPPLTAPCLVVTCEHDSGSTPQMSQAIAAEIAGSEILIIPELKHLGLIEQPALFSAAINDFLTHTLQPSGQ